MGNTLVHRDSDSAALVIGFTIQGLAIARALRKSGVNVYAIVQGGHDGRVIKHPALYSDNATILYADNLRAEGLVDALLTARKVIPESRVVLYPVTDNSVIALAKQWPALDSEYILSWASCRGEVECIVEKRNLPGYCESADVLYPKTFVIDSDEDINPCLKNLGFPILLKPNKQGFSFKTHRCDTSRELISFVQSRASDWPLIAQEWVEGGDSSLYFYTCFSINGDEYFGFSGRKVRASPPGVGIATVLETFDEPGVRDAAQKLLPELKVSGPIAMEFKKDSEGNFRFIEANVGRMEFCVDLAIQAGFNLPYVEFNYATGAPLPMAETWQDCIWFDTDKEPLCYAMLCLTEGTLRPHGKSPVLPYHGQERLRVRLAAIFEMMRKFSTRIFRRFA